MRRRWARRGTILVPIIVIVAGIALSARLASEIRDRAGARFRRAGDEVELRLRGRLDTYVAMLLGGEGLFAVAGEVSREDFRGYVERLDIPHRFPGVQGIGFARRILPGEAEEVVARARADGIDDFQLWPAGGGPLGTAVVYLEPLDRRNRTALGFDMSAESVRREAMERARDTGAPAASGPVTLVQEIDPRKQLGFLLYVPVFQDGAAASTAARRRDALAGFVYAPFRAGDLLQHALAGSIEPGVGFELVDAATSRVMERGGIARERGVIFAEERTLEVAGRRWRLRTFADHVVLGALSEAAPVFVLGMALLLAAVLRFFLRAMVRAQAAAEEHAREATQLAEATAEAVRLRDDFLSIASHELRTPITPLRLQLQLIRRQGIDGHALDPRLRRSLDVAERQVDRLVELTDDLLDVTRIQAGRLRLEPVEVDLGPLVQGVAARHAAQAAAAGSELSGRAPGGAVARIDPARFDQVVTNLLTNAIKYGGGHPIDVTLTHTDGSAALEVRDLGIGISTDDLPRIFRRFERASSGHNYGGLGLGLYITHELVVAMGGAITAHSEPGKGSTFRVVFPLAERPAAGAPARPS